MNIKVKIKGDKKIISKMNKLVTGINRDAYPAVESAGRYLLELSKKLLESKRGQGYTGIDWGTSANPIADSGFVSKTGAIGGSPTVVVGFTSPHAFVVEYGALVPDLYISENERGTMPAAKSESAPIFTFQDGDKLFPIGKQQGWTPPIYATRFRIQPGYHYFYDAYTSMTFRHSFKTGLMGELWQVSKKYINGLGK